MAGMTQWPLEDVRRTRGTVVANIVVVAFAGAANTHSFALGKVKLVSIRVLSLPWTSSGSRGETKAASSTVLSIHRPCRLTAASFKAKKESKGNKLEQLHQGCACPWRLSSSLSSSAQVLQLRCLIHEAVESVRVER